jgi:hypothetical protein
MQWSDIQFRPPARTLRQFAGIWICFFGGLAAYQGLYRGHTTLAAVLAALALTIGPAGLARPDLIRPVYVGWMVLAFPIGWTISQAVLLAMYYLVVTPTSFALRITGRDPLRLRRPAADTYWEPKSTPADPRRYLRQY